MIGSSDDICSWFTELKKVIHFNIVSQLVIIILASQEQDVSCREVSYVSSHHNDQTLSVILKQKLFIPDFKKSLSLDE